MHVIMHNDIGLASAFLCSLGATKWPLSERAGVTLHVLCTRPALGTRAYVCEIANDDIHASAFQGTHGVAERPLSERAGRVALHVLRTRPAVFQQRLGRRSATLYRPHCLGRRQVDAPRSSEGGPGSGAARHARRVSRRPLPILLWGAVRAGCLRQGPAARDFKDPGYQESSQSPLRALADHDPSVQGGNDRSKGPLAASTTLL
jgi:hypothetical protein